MLLDTEHIPLEVEMFKFVHIADTHLDSAIKSNEENQELIISELQRAFESSVDLCIDENCHAFLISGDLFDDERLSYKTEIMLRESFDRLAKNGIRVFYCLGNHDSKASKIRRFKLGDNVHIYDSETVESVEVRNEKGKIIAIVAGVGYPNKHVSENLSKNFTSIRGHLDIPIVAMLHTSLDIGGDKHYSPCTYDDLSAHPFDYWALGHIHKSAVYGKNKVAVFPGCTCGRDFGETGQKGAYLVTLNKDGVSKYDFIELANITWHDEMLNGFEDANEINDMMDICAKKISDTIDDSKINFIRITLTGQCSMYSAFDDEAVIEMQGGLRRRTGANVTIRNNLSSLINPDDYIKDKHLLSVALNMAEQAKSDVQLQDEILDIVKLNYKGLDGDDDREYIASLLDNIKSKLCDVMIKQED